MKATSPRIAFQSELDTIAAVVSAMGAAHPGVRRRLVHGVAVLLASSDGRYLEAIDVHLSQLDRVADELKANTKGGAS